MVLLEGGNNSIKLKKDMFILKLGAMMAVLLTIYYYYLLPLSSLSMQMKTSGDC